MKFTFDLTEQDYLDFNMFTVRNYKLYKKQSLLLRIIFAIVPFATGLVMWLLKGAGKAGVDFNIGTLVAMIILSLLFWFMAPKLFDRMTLRNAKKILFREGNSNIPGERSVSFDAENIRTVTEYEESLMQYGAITEIKQSDNAIYIYISPAMAIILPFRAFSDEAEKQALLDFVSARMQ